MILIIFLSHVSFAENFIISKLSTFSSFDVSGYKPDGKMYIKAFKDGINKSNIKTAEYEIKSEGKVVIAGDLDWSDSSSAFIAGVDLKGFQQGDVLAVLIELKASKGGGRVKGKVDVTIGDAGPVADAGTDKINAGFGATVKLDGKKSTGENIKYDWKISQANDASIVVLKDNGDGTADLVLPDFDTLVKPEPYQPVYDNARVFAMSYDMTGTYEVKLTVTDDQGRASADYVEISATSRTSGLKNVPLGQPVYFVAPESETYSWVLTSKPDKAASELNESTSRISNFVPDVEGRYTIEEKNSDSVIPIHVGTYVGVGSIGDKKEAEVPQCFVCHRAIHKGWQGTHHSFAFANKYNGVLADGETEFPFFREFCVKCHTTGVDKAIKAKNSGFDDKALKEGWTYPLPDQNGNVDPENFNNMLKKFPETAQMTQVQCEMCHGPGSELHLFQKNNDAIDRTLHPTLCGQCHSSVPSSNRYVEWMSSKHARSVRMGNPRVSGVPAGVNPESPANGCGIHCHTVEGFLRFRVFEATPNPDIYSGRRNDAAPISCILCHNPMSNFGDMDDDGNVIEDGRKQLRFYGKTTIPKWNEDETSVINVEVDAGPAAICTKCHLHNMYIKDFGGNVKSEPVPFKIGEGAPIHQQAQVFFGIGASEYDPIEFGLGAYPEPTHVKAFREKYDEPKYCVHCHMMRYKSSEEQFGKLGSHTWNMRYTEDDPRGESYDTSFENGKPCLECHEQAKDDNAPGGYSFAFGKPASDYLKSLLSQLAGLLPLDERGRVVWNPDGTDFGTPDDLSDDVPALTTKQIKAAFNYYFIYNDRSNGHHNMAYAVRLLGDAVRSLGGTPIEREE